MSESQKVRRVHLQAESTFCKGILSKDDVRAVITPNEEFKRDIAIIRKNAQQKYIGALIKFHYRRVERNTTKLHGIKQLKLKKSNDEKLI